MKISVFGSGYVGVTTGACLANLGHEILCVDIDENKINMLKEGKIHFYEPGLKELVIKNKEKGRLSFTTNLEEGINFGGIIFNCVGTPQTEEGAANLEYVFSVAKEAAKSANGHKLLVNKSTVPPGTAQKCNDIIREINPYSDVEVVSNPEFLAEGKAVYDFTHPDKIVVGAKSGRAFSQLRRVYTGRIRTYIPIVETDWETAEMIKYANNSFLATKISFINEIANICDKVGADIKLVAQAMGMDYRISAKFLNAGVGYGGSCFPKDVRALAYAAQGHGYEAKLLREVDLVNERQKQKIIEKIHEKFGEDLSEHIFTVWGLSFKPNTSDIREAPSLVVVKELLRMGAKLNVYDPVAHDEFKQHHAGERQEQHERISYAGSLKESVVGSSAIVLLTEWDEFRNTNFSDLASDMKGKIIFDGRNIYEPGLVKEEGFEYFGVGRK